MTKSETHWDLFLRAVKWIAENDNEGSAERLDAEAIAGYLTVMLVADVFGMPPAAIADRVVMWRRKRTDARERAVRMGMTEGGA